MAENLSTGTDLQLELIDSDTAEFLVFYEADLTGTGTKLYAGQLSFGRDGDNDWKIVSF